MNQPHFILLTTALFITSCASQSSQNNSRLEPVTKYDDRKISSNNFSEDNSNKFSHTKFAEPLSKVYLFAPKLTTKSTSIPVNTQEINDQTCKVEITKRTNNLIGIDIVIKDATTEKLFHPENFTSSWQLGIPMTDEVDEMPSTKYPNHEFNKIQWRYSIDSSVLTSLTPVENGRVIRMVLKVDPSLEIIQGLKLELLGGRINSLLVTQDGLTPESADTPTEKIMATFDCVAAFM